MVARVRGPCESGVAVFLREQAGVVVGDLDWVAFEGRVAEREEIFKLWDLSEDGVGSRERGKKVSYLFFVLIFGAHYTLFGLVWPHGGNVDEKTCLYVYPPCIDDV